MSELYNLAAIKRSAAFIGRPWRTLTGSHVLAMTAVYFDRLPATEKTPAAWHRIKNDCHAELENEPAEIKAEYEKIRQESLS